jgi:hypothetical protein
VQTGSLRSGRARPTRRFPPRPAASIPKHPPPPAAAGTILSGCSRAPPSQPRLERCGPRPLLDRPARRSMLSPATLTRPVSWAPEPVRAVVVLPVPKVFELLGIDGIDDIDLDKLEVRPQCPRWSHRQGRNMSTITNAVVSPRPNRQPRSRTARAQPADLRRRSPGRSPRGRQVLRCFQALIVQPEHVERARVPGGELRIVVGADAPLRVLFRPGGLCAGSGSRSDNRPRIHRGRPASRGWSSG